MLCEDNFLCCERFVEMKQSEATSSWKVESIQHCHQPKRCSCQSRGRPPPSPRTPPTSPQTGGRGCDTTGAAANRGWNRTPKVGTFQRLTSHWERRSPQQPLALISGFVADIIGSRKWYRVFFNWSAPFFVRNEKNCFLDWKFLDKVALVGCKSFFVLELKIGRNW